MSMANWTSHAFGVTDHELSQLSPLDIVRKAEETLRDEYLDELYSVAQSYMSYYDPDTDETLYDVLQSLVEADEDTNPWDSVYEIDGMTVIATAFMLLVLQKLNASPYWHYFEWNGETSDQIVGIPMCYAWEAPASIQQLNEDAIKSAFIDIFTEFNVTIDPNTVGDHELENWG